jgi:hypothetical protein
VCTAAEAEPSKAPAARTTAFFIFTAQLEAVYYDSEMISISRPSYPMIIEEGQWREGGVVRCRQAEVEEMVGEAAGCVTLTSSRGRLRVIARSCMNAALTKQNPATSYVNTLPSTPSSCLYLHVFIV